MSGVHVLNVCMPARILLHIFTHYSVLVADRVNMRLDNYTTTTTTTTYTHTHTPV